MPNYSIKDKDNLFNHNAWALGDILPLPALTYSNYSTTFEVSKEYAANGDYSVKATSTSESIRPIAGILLTDVSDLINHTVQFTASVKNTAPCMLAIYKTDSENHSSSSNVRVPVGEGTYTLTTVVAENIVKIWLRVDYVNTTFIGDVFYVDNFQLHIQ